MILKIVTIFITISILATMFGGLLHMAHEASNAQGGCPFMVSGESVCSMNVFDHISSWQDNFLALAPLLLLLFSVGTGAYLYQGLPKRFLHKVLFYVWVPSRWYAERLARYIQNILQELFSQGILHPKLF